jgi:hypothetical protein
MRLGSRVAGAWRVALLAGVLLAACGSSSGSGQAGAGKAIEAYLQARAESNLDAMTRLACPDWETQARVEATSFQSMNAKLDGVSCQATGEQGGATLVACQGKIVTAYQGETREWSVADHPYKAVEIDGEWRMCGYGN